MTGTINRSEVDDKGGDTETNGTQGRQSRKAYTTQGSAPQIGSSDFIASLSPDGFLAMSLCSLLQFSLPAVSQCHRWNAAAGEPRGGQRAIASALAALG